MAEIRNFELADVLMILKLRLRKEIKEMNTIRSRTGAIKGEGKGRRGMEKWGGEKKRTKKRI